MKGRGRRKDVAYYYLSFDLVYDPVEMGNGAEEGKKKFCVVDLLSCNAKLSI